MIGRWVPDDADTGQTTSQGASDGVAIPFVYHDYLPVRTPKNLAEYAAAWGVPGRTLSLKEGLMVTEIVKERAAVSRMYIMGRTRHLRPRTSRTLSTGFRSSSSSWCTTCSSRKLDRTP